MGRLTAASVRAALRESGTYSDGDGLRLKVGKTGAASWILRIQKNGKRQDFGLGSVQLVSLGEAREKAREMRKAIKIEGRDIKAERTSEAASKVTFRQAAERFHAENEESWSRTYARQWMASLESHVFPTLAGRPTATSFPEYENVRGTFSRKTPKR